MFRNSVILSISMLVVSGCSEGEQTQSQSIAEEASTKIESAKAEGKEAISAIEENAAAAVEEIVSESESAVEDVQEETQDSISNIQADAESAMAKLKQEAEAAKSQLQARADDVATADSVPADIVSSDKPYQLVDGQISDNAMEGWRTYNGGGCGACHGKGGIGAVGPNLGNSVTQKLSKEQFVDIVTNGVSGTMMRPHNTNTRVMENLDNLYAYLVARGDGVLGPGNLIKSPLGKE